MATGDQNDILARLKAVLPPWFPYVTPILDGLLSGPANGLAFAYSLLASARLQTRLATMTGGWLDLTAYDYFGYRIQRNANEADTLFRARLKKEILRPRVTRGALTQTLVDLTGFAPAIFEPARPADTGSYGVGGAAYGCAGGYGSLQYPFQAFVTMYRPPGAGIPYVSGYGGTAGGYGIGAIEYANASLIIGGVTDPQMYAAADAVRPAGSIIWAQIQTPLVNQSIIAELTVGNLSLGGVCAPVVLSQNLGTAVAGKAATLNLGTVP